MMRPEDIKSRTFTNALRGYDRDEVRSFLDTVAASIQELSDRLAAAEAQLEAPEAAADDQFTGDAAVDVSAEEGPSLDDAEQAIVDRYGALGDRIADLLRHADESAAAIMQQAHDDADELRSTAVADAAHERSEAEQHAAELLSESRALRFEIDTYRDEVMTDLETARTEQEAALSNAKAVAEAEIETFRIDSIDEIEALRGTASSEVEELRAAAQLDAEAARESAVAEGRAAIEEHEVEAARLREEAEDDRAAARAELDDVRSEVSSLLEQARTQSEFIKQEADEIIRTKVRANFEQAQARLDVLRHTEISSRERILRAQTELSSALTRLDAEPAPELDPMSGSAVIEEAERRQAELDEPDGDGFESDAAFDAGPIDSELIDNGPIDTELIDSELIDNGPRDAAPTESEIVDVEEVDRSTFEADVAEASQQIDAEGWSPLSPFLDAVPEADATPAEEGDGEPGFAAVEFGASADADTGEATPSGENTDDASLQSPEPPPANAGDVAANDTAIGGPADEDALARLVREAMQEAVDSARKQD